MRHNCILGLVGLGLGLGCSLEPVGHTAFGDAGTEDTAAADTGAGEGDSAPADTSASAGSADESGDGPADSSEGGGSTSEGVDASAGDSSGDASAGSESTSGVGEDSGSTSGAGESSSEAGGPGPEGGQVGDEPQIGGVCSGGGIPSTYTEAQPEPELHIFGVYQGLGGQIDVAIDRVGIPLVIVLSSYEPVTWQLDLAPGVELDEVILNGYEEQMVMGQGAATVTDKSGIGSYLSACAYTWPGDNQGCDTPALVQGVEQLTGSELASFAGCYEGASFSLL